LAVAGSTSAPVIRLQPQVLPYPDRHHNERRASEEGGYVPGWESVEQMWEAFRSNAGLAEGTAYSAWHFCDNKTDADELAELVVAGVKRATAGALWAYEAEGEALPQTGDLSVITDWEGRPHAIIRVVSVEVLPFREVTPEFAAAEGEGGGSLRFWREAHWAAFSRELEVLGREPAEDMPVVCERFEMVFPKA
jgi:uncharacterized protein YhfF